MSLRLDGVRYAYRAREWVVRIDALDIGPGPSRCCWDPTDVAKAR